jgi:hypothetical protein
VAEIYDGDYAYQQRRDPDDCVNHAPRYRNPGTTAAYPRNVLIR